MCDFLLVGNILCGRATEDSACEPVQRKSSSFFFSHVKQKQVSSEVQEEVVHVLQTPFIIIRIVSPCVSQLALTSGKRVFYISVYQASWQTEETTDLHFLLRHFQRGTPLDAVSKTTTQIVSFILQVKCFLCHWCHEPNIHGLSTLVFVF